jgi:hypothetical protein
MKKPGVAGFFISAIDPLPIERAAANAKPGTEDFNGPILVTSRWSQLINCRRNEVDLL